MQPARGSLCVDLSTAHEATCVLQLWRSKLVLHVFAFPTALRRRAQTPINRLKMTQMQLSRYQSCKLTPKGACAVRARHF
jgi:hypothetical protein